MPTTSRAALFLSLLLIGVGSLSCIQAQEAIRPSIAGAEAARARKKSVVEPYNIKFGPVTFKLSAYARAEYVDNINLSENAPVSDFIIGPYLTARGAWQVSTLNTLRFDIGLGYEKYLSHSEFDSASVLLSPGSRISYDIYIGGDMRLILHDSFMVSQDPTSQADLSNVTSFRRFENNLGATLIWDLNQLVLTFGYSHFNYISLEDEYEYLNRNAEILSASAAYQLNPTTTVGLDTSFLYTYYDEEFQNDSTTLNCGPFWEMTVSNYLKFRFATGLQTMAFKSGGGNGDDSDSNSWYANLAVVHRLNRIWTHSLNLGRETLLGLQTNSQETYYVRYSADAQIFRRVTTSFHAFYEHIQESDGLDPEAIDRYGAGFRLGYQLNRKTQLGAGYQFLNKDSNLPDRNYLQNRVFVDARYEF